MSNKPVYIVVEVEKVVDRGVYSQYVDKAQGIVEGHGGTYLARSERVSLLSSGPGPEKVCYNKV